MAILPLYILNRFIFRITEFLRHWYVRGIAFFAHHTIVILSALDTRVAFGITLRHFGEPLYQDRTIIGYILGFIFRSLRLVMGGFVYGVIIILAALLYALWAALPLYVIFRIALPFLS
ncbi:hypothetical protein HY504_00810 [Candidatus Wolfebacteria bacterium]|nr:hypothetical protein [Candidatus Wolfebacteria bacterium]